MNWFERLVVLFWICFVIAVVFVFTMVCIHGPEESQRRQQAIFENGRSAALEGSPVEVCPYVPGWGGVGEYERKTWMNGFREGMREKKKKE